MKLNLCIDIDGTITDEFYWLDYANRYFDTDVKPKQVKTYNFNEPLQVTREEYFKFYELHWETLHSKAKVREGAKEVLWKLSENHNIYYVTAREAQVKNVTVEWFRKNNLPGDELYLLGSHYKVGQAEELDCDIFIEDRYENAIELSLAGFKVLLIDCTYNRQPLLPGITRVYNWNQIYEEIQDHYEKVNKEAVRIA
jgi:uncharacterized HAD superfamily protein